MIRRAGTVAVASAAALTLLDQRRAEAATGGNFILGQANDANATTELSATAGSPTLNPLFRLSNANLSGTSTTMIIDGAPSPGGVGLVINGAAGALGLRVNASSTPTTTGLAISASGAGTASGISSSSGSGSGVAGSSTSGAGVAGSSTSGAGVAGSSTSGTGVSGTSASGTGVRATGKRGGDFSGKAAAIRLRPATGPHPHSGTTGDLFVDNLGHLFYCRKGGSLATWVKLA